MTRPKKRVDHLREVGGLLRSNPLDREQLHAALLLEAQEATQRAAERGVVGPLRPCRKELGRRAW